MNPLQLKDLVFHLIKNNRREFDIFIQTFKISELYKVSGYNLRLCWFDAATL